MDQLPVVHSNKRSVVLVVSSLSGGGAERITSMLANQWSRQGWKVAVATLTQDERQPYLLDKDVARISLPDSAKCRWFAVRLLVNVRRVVRLRRTIRTIKPDIVLGVMPAACVLVACAGIGLSAVKIGTERVHPPAQPLSILRELVRKYSYKMLDAVVALTEESAAWISRHTRAQVVKVIPNPASWPLVQMPPYLDPTSTLGADRRIVLGVGRLDKQKGFDLLIQAFSQLASAFPFWDVVILGEGGERPELMRLAADLGIQNRIHLVGRVGNVADWYQRANVFVLSSRYEGFPNALIEAMSSGVACIAFDCDTGPRDIVTDDVNGKLVSQEDVSALTEALRSYMSSESLRRSVGLAATEVRTRFSPSMVLAKWDALFTELIVTRHEIQRPHL